MIVRRVMFFALLLLSAVCASGAERDVLISAKFVGPVARIYCEQGFPGPRRSWGINSHISLPQLSVIKDIRLKRRKKQRLGLRNDGAGYHKKGSYYIQANIPRVSINIPTGDEKLLFTAEAVYDIDENGWITFIAPVKPVKNGTCFLELSIVEPRLVSKWELPRGFKAKVIKPGEYVVTGQMGHYSRHSTALTLQWKVKNYAKFSPVKTVGDLFRFNKKSGVVQIAGVPVKGVSTCLNIFVRGKAKPGVLGEVQYSKARKGSLFYSRELSVPRHRVFDFSGSDMGNVVIKNLGFHRQYLDFVREIKKSGKLSDRLNRRLKAIASSYKGVISPLKGFTTYKPDSFKRIKDYVIENVVDDLYFVLGEKGKSISVTKDGWDTLHAGHPALNKFYKQSMKKLRNHALGRDKKTGWFFGNKQYSKKDCKRMMKTLLGAIEMVCLDSSICISKFHETYTQDTKARLQFLRLVDIVDTFVANKGIHAYVADLRLVRNNQYFTLPELSNLFWSTLARQGYIHPANSAKKPFYNEFIIMPGFKREDSQSEYDDFDIYCPLYDLNTKDYR